MTTALVLGRGFGLYGHAAALAGMGWQVLLPASYREDVAARPELAHLTGQLGFVENPEAAPPAVDLICLARRPQDNAALATRLAGHPDCPPLVIEKPIAATPGDASRLAAELGATRWAVPYLFRHTDWADALKTALTADQDCRIHWQHRQAATLKGWKHDPSEGGGALAFYLIHMIALIHELDPGGMDIRQQDGSWHLTGTHLQVRFETGDAMGFSVRTGAQTVFSAASPFGAAPTRGAPDPRIGPLQRFHAAFQTDPELQADLHARVHDSWADAVGTATSDGNGAA